MNESKKYILHKVFNKSWLWTECCRNVFAHSHWKIWNDVNNKLFNFYCKVNRHRQIPLVLGRWEFDWNSVVTSAVSWWQRTFNYIFFILYQQLISILVFFNFSLIDVLSELNIKCSTIFPLALIYIWMGSLWIEVLLMGSWQINVYLCCARDQLLFDICVWCHFKFRRISLCAICH